VLFANDLAIVLLQLAIICIIAYVTRWTVFAATLLETANNKLI